MTRETVEAKGRRYLTEGRVVVVHAQEGYLEAVCRGAGEFYGVYFESRGGWRCFCPASGRCAHLIAVQLVTAPQPNDIAHWLSRSREDVRPCTPEPVRGSQ